MPKPRLILEACSGRMFCRKAIISPDEALHISPSQCCGEIELRETELAGAAFKLHWDGQIGYVQPLKAKERIFVGGQQTGDFSKVDHGAWIRAGNSDFIVQVERTEKASNDEIDLLVAHLRLQEKDLFAILDASRDEQIRVLLHDHVDSYRCLFDGVQAERIADAAPFLVKLHADSSLLNELLARGWGKRWGVYLTADQPIDTVRRHLRKFLRVRDETTREYMLFRFYDPWVLHHFLPTCTTKQKQDFFHSMFAFFTEDPSATLNEPIRWNI